MKLDAERGNRLAICPSAETLLQNYFRTHADSLDGNQSATNYDSDFLSTRLASQQEKQRKPETCKVIVYIWTDIPGFSSTKRFSKSLATRNISVPRASIHQYIIDTLVPYHPLSKTLSLFQSILVNMPTPKKVPCCWNTVVPFAAQKKHPPTPGQCLFSIIMHLKKRRFGSM